MWNQVRIWFFRSGQHLDPYYKSFRDMVPISAPAQDDGLAIANAIRSAVENRLDAIVSDRATCWQMVGNLSIAARATLAA